MGKPDLKAPRFRNEILGTINRLYIKHLRSKLELSVTDEQIKTVIRTFNTLVWKSVIENRDGVDLPGQLGNIIIVTCPTTIKENKDYRNSSLSGEKVIHKNWDTDNKIGKIFYTNEEIKYRFKNYEIWGFSASRDFKRAVAKTYPVLWKRYIQIDHNFKVSKIFRKNFLSQMKDPSFVDLKEYDEFALD